MKRHTCIDEAVSRNLPAGKSLSSSFFARRTENVARDLLGKVLVTCVDGHVTAGKIVETEAYLGSEDPGSHAATRGITSRNRVMYGSPGRIYVYFTYGAHYMLNIVTEREGRAGAVLIRAVEPLSGEDIMNIRRRGRSPKTPARGPGCVTQAFGVDLSLNDVNLGEAIDVWDAPDIDDSIVATTGRVGLSQGHELPLRYYVCHCQHVSKGRVGPKLNRKDVHKGRDEEK